MILTSFPPGVPANVVGPPPAPATSPRVDRAGSRLLVVNAASESVRDSHFRELPQLLAPEDLLVVNDAATLPASLAARTASRGALELRLAAFEDDGFTALALGSGTFRDPTELRGRRRSFGQATASRSPTAGRLRSRLASPDVDLTPRARRARFRFDSIARRRAVVGALPRRPPRFSTRTPRASCRSSTSRTCTQVARSRSSCPRRGTPSTERCCSPSDGAASR